MVAQTKTAKPTRVKPKSRVEDSLTALTDTQSPRRHSDGGTPTIFLKARLNAASDP
jgi:hypothetical protein